MVPEAEPHKSAVQQWSLFLKP